jgi:hypothetical protein
MVAPTSLEASEKQPDYINLQLHIQKDPDRVCLMYAKSETRSTITPGKEGKRAVPQLDASPTQGL